VLAGGEESRALQSRQRPQGIAIQNGGQATPKDHLHRLHQKFNLTNPADPQLDVSALMAPVGNLDVDRRLDVLHLPDDGGRPVVRAARRLDHEALNHAKERPSHGSIPGDRPGF
jgi:hypothetical protein